MTEAALDTIHRRYLTFRLAGWMAVGLAGLAFAATGSGTAVVVTAIAVFAVVPEAAMSSSLAAKLGIALGLDTMLATALWWTAGPVAAVDLLAVLAVGGAGVLLAPRPAQTVIILGIVAGALRVVLVAVADPPWFTDFSTAARIEADASILDSLLLVIVLGVVGVLSTRLGSILHNSLVGIPRAEEARRLAVDEVPTGLWWLTLSPQPELVEVNAAAADMVGSGSPAMFLEGFPGLVHTADLDRLLEVMAERPRGSELVDLTKMNGTPLRALATWTTIPDGRILVSLADLTDRLDKDAFDRRRERRFFAGVDLAPVPLILVDPVGYVLHANQSAAGFLEADPVALAGTPFEQLVASADRDQVGDAVSRLGAGISADFTAELHSRGGKPLHVTGVAAGTPPEVLVFRLGH